MVYSVDLKHSAVTRIVDFRARGQFAGSRLRKPTAPQLICLFQEFQIADATSNRYPVSCIL